MQHSEGHIYQANAYEAGPRPGTSEGELLSSTEASTVTLALAQLIADLSDPTFAYSLRRNETLIIEITKETDHGR